MKIITIDGEGFTLTDGTHIYTLLMDSTGRYIENMGGLHTAECLDFLLELPKANLYSGFSIGYDVDMILGDLNREEVTTLYNEHELNWRGYHIEWIPRKELTIKKNGRNVHIFDCFGFFQSSFVRTLKEWKIGSADEVEHIAAMKDRRGTFEQSQREEIRAYCLRECELLVELLTYLISILHKAGIHLRRYDGSGAIGAALLTKYRVNHWERKMDSSPVDVPARVLAAYYGGRFDVGVTGVVNDVYAYDIRSAYPAIAVYLPCLYHTNNTYGSDYLPGSMSLYRVQWSLPTETRYPPFPWRSADKRICYPINGDGWYWWHEVEPAIGMYGDGIKVVERVTLHNWCGRRHQPFEFLQEMYRKRAEYKAAGDMVQLALKLGLNSVYGKLAQSIGYKGRRPTHQNYVWAGMITSGTRGMILRAIYQNPDAILSIATDGILSRNPLDLKIGTGLGEWEYTHYRQAKLYQPGMYELTTDNGETIHKTRGAQQREVDFTKLGECFMTDPYYGEYKYRCTRFIGMGAATQRLEFDTLWRRWIELDKVIRFAPTSRVTDCPLPDSVTGDETEPFNGEVICHATRLTGELHSTPYRPKHGWNDAWADELGDPYLMLDLEQP